MLTDSILEVRESSSINIIRTHSQQTHCQNSGATLSRKSRRHGELTVSIIHLFIHIFFRIFFFISSYFEWNSIFGMLSHFLYETNNCSIQNEIRINFLKNFLSIRIVVVYLKKKIDINSHIYTNKKIIYKRHTYRTWLHSALHYMQRM